MVGGALFPKHGAQASSRAPDPLYLSAPSKRPAWLQVGRLLREWRIPKDIPSERQFLAQAMELRRAADLGKEFRPVERGWCLGSEQFRRELLEQVSVLAGASHFGELIQEAAEVQAERTVRARLKELGWAEGDFAVRRKGDARKVELADELRTKTTMPLAWIAQRLGMGSRGYLTWLLYRHHKGRT